MTNRYAQGKIYKIVNTVDDRIYVGSTCLPLAKRFYDHKRTGRQRPTQRVYEALNTIGWENARMVLVEAFACENKQELIAREQYFMDLLRPSLNNYAASGKLCDHQRRRGLCKDCGGSRICVHQRQRNQCKDCEGSQVCKHQRRRSMCKDCGGSSICEHQRQRNSCSDCSPVECDFCGIIICKGRYNIHCRTAKHKANESAEFMRVFGFPME